MIVDTQNSDNEEDDQFVVEAAPPLPEMSELEMVRQRECRFLSLHLDDTGAHMPAFKLMDTKRASDFSVRFLSALILSLL